MPKGHSFLLEINSLMKLRDIFEAPISDISHVGDWGKNSSFDARDRKLLTNPKAIQKIKGMWKHPSESMVNVLLMNRYDMQAQRNGGTAVHTEVGMVDTDWLEQNMARDWETIEPLLKMNELNIIYTNNKGDERVPMTGWIMAHRLGHAFWASTRGQRQPGGVYYFKESVDEFEKLMFEVMKHYHIHDPDQNRFYRTRQLPRNGALRGFLHTVCKFKSARDKNIRNPFEVIFELFAQYMVTGAVTFNDPPESFRYGREFYRADQQEVEDLKWKLENLGDLLTEYFECALNYSDGKIFVM